MKKYVPFTSVSVDLETQEKGNGDSEEKLSINEDGCIISDQIVPKCCGSGARSVSQLLSEMRYGTCLWGKRFIRKMNEFHFEQTFEGWGKRAIDMTRQSDNKILISWRKEDGAEKKVAINEYGWNCFISYLFNEIEIDLWNQVQSFRSKKIYLPDGRPYREVPTLDGGEWSIRIIGEGRNHEYKGTNRVPEKWENFISYINKVEDAIDLADPGDSISI